MAMQQGWVMPFESFYQEDSNGTCTYVDSTSTLAKCILIALNAM